MYQTNIGLSTRRLHFAGKFYMHRDYFCAPQPAFGRRFEFHMKLVGSKTGQDPQTQRTSVMWPIFRPGRGAPLPYR